MADMFTRTEHGISMAGDTIRIEAGPALVKAKATPEVLADDVTAAHYQPPRPATPDEIASPGVLTEGDHRLFLDAKGQPIKPGQDFHYLDHLNTRAPDAGPVFYLYQLLPPTPEEQKARAHDGTGDAGLPASDGSDPFFHEIGVFDTESEAINAALQLIGG
jgi:hypothetical protein